MQMTTTRSTQIFNNAPTLQVALATMEAAGRTHRQHTLHITCAAFALCPETALTPQYGLTHNTLSKVVGRIYTLITNKCPKILAMFDNPAATCRSMRIRPSPPVQEALPHALQRYILWMYSMTSGLIGGISTI